jgi:hypothetical protein
VRVVVGDDSSNDEVTLLSHGASVLLIVDHGDRSARVYLDRQQVAVLAMAMTRLAECDPQPTTPPPF